MDEKYNRIAVANMKARLRMLLLYKEANKLNGLVAGMDDRSEHELGYYTKYGDDGVDIKCRSTSIRHRVEMFSFILAGK